MRAFLWLGVCGLLSGLVPSSVAQPSGAVTGGRVRCEQGRAGAFTCNNVDLLAYLPIPDLGGGGTTRLNDVWGWTDPATGREYALVGRTDGTAFVDVTDPLNPVFMGSLPLTAGARPSTWRDIKVYADHAFVVADLAGQHGMQVFDLRRLRDAAGPPAVFAATAHYGGINSAHNLALDESTGFAYITGGSGGGNTCGGGLHMVDVRDPLAPAFAGCAAAAGYVHDAQCVVYHGPDADYEGREVCVASAAAHLAVFDVTDKTRPVMIASVTYPDARYVHQGWFTDDRRYFFQDDELDEGDGVVPRTRTLIWDMTDLDEPVFLEPYFAPVTATDHNLYVRGERVYQANYKSGLRVLDIHVPERPTEAAFFDTYPPDDTPGYQGAWNVYPYFDSGTLVVSSIGEGLFVLALSGLAAATIDGFTATPREGGVQFSWDLQALPARVRFQIEEFTGMRPGYPEWTVVGELPEAEGQAGAYSFDLPDVFPGRHRYRVRAIDDTGSGVASPPVDVRLDVDGSFALESAYPNPFREQLHVTLAVGEEQRVRVALYDVLGRRVAGLYDGLLPANEQQIVTFTPPADLGSGTYVVRITGERFATTRIVTHL